jgi:DNA-binding transcriptional ArsR family regulator
MATADLILHPVRLRIVRAFLGGRPLTTIALAAALADVPAATLYRHVARLVDAGVLEVVAERRVRGAFERTYVLHVAATNIGADDLAGMTTDEHRQMFITFVAGLIGDFDSYLAQGDTDLFRDKVRFRLADLWLTDAELRELAAELTQVIVPRLGNAPGPGRTRRALRTFLLPASDSVGRQAGGSAGGSASDPAGGAAASDPAGDRPGWAVRQDGELTEE